ncbi:MAG: transposase [Acidobacteria bacterium]|nr:transposase [Acidobacteriota bacterium]
MAKTERCLPLRLSGGSAPWHEGGQARRWVVERTHAWLDRFRRLVVNWEKTSESRYAFLCLACPLIAYRI